MKEKYINIDAEEDTNQKELIEQDLDNQPVDPQEDIFLNNISEPEEIPSCLTYEEYLRKRLNEKGFKIVYGELEVLRDEYNEDYIKDYRRQLRKWYFNNPKNKLFNLHQSFNTRELDIDEC